MRQAIMILFFLSWLVMPAADIGSREVSGALQRLDRREADRKIFKALRHARIDSLKRYRSETTVGDDRWFESTMLLGDAYNAFDNDSSIFFYTAGLQQSLSAGLDSLVDVFRIKRATLLPLAGRDNESVDELSMVDTTDMGREMKLLYLENARQLYSYIASLHSEEIDLAEYWNNKAFTTQLELISLLDNNSDLYMLNYGEHLCQLRQYGSAEAVLKRLVERLPEESNIYARALHMLSDIARSNGQHNRSIYYLAESAAADIRAATLEVVSLQELGIYLYDNDDLERSYAYLSVALENAVECKAPLRMLSISSALPLIGQAHTDQSVASRRKLTAALIIMVILLAGLAGLLVYLKIQVTRKGQLKDRLEAANNTKEIYLSQFMNLCSVFMDKLISFNMTVNRKISAGQVDELFKITKSGKLIEEESREFYEMFDNAFLHIYPSFVDSVNALLQPDKQIVLADGEHLNTDLRILACIRLGMVDASRVARALNFSVNTIYAYRTRLRNRAINRDTFERDIMRIQSV